ncbi:unnamed protein product [marine sediment metagenome]|uniref:Uncharacterized protein n=1 Tax=marine sediment metagenome TaxID=412755 RepID=X0U403_9ZZZZ
MHGGRKVGPVSTAELEQLAANEAIQPNDRVRRVGSKHVLHRLVAGRGVVAMDPLGFQLSEKACGRRVIVAVTPPAQAAEDAMFLEELLEVARRLQTAAVAVIQQAYLWLVMRKGHPQLP